MLVTISPVRDHDGQVVGASSIARDVTEAASTRRASNSEPRTSSGPLPSLQLTSRRPRAGQLPTSRPSPIASLMTSAPRCGHLSGFSAALLEEYGDRLDEVGRGYAEQIEAGAEQNGPAHR